MPVDELISVRPEVAQAVRTALRKTPECLTGNERSVLKELFGGGKGYQTPAQVADRVALSPEAVARCAESGIARALDVSPARYKKRGNPSPEPDRESGPRAFDLKSYQESLKTALSAHPEISERNREMLELRMSLTGSPPVSAAALAKKYGITAKAVHYQVCRTIGKLEIEPPENDEWHQINRAVNL